MVKRIEKGGYNVVQQRKAGVGESGSRNYYYKFYCVKPPFKFLPDKRKQQNEKVVIDKIEKQTEDKTVDFLGHVSLYEYDNHGNVSKITDLDEDGSPCLEIDYENIYE